MSIGIKAAGSLAIMLMVSVQARAEGVLNIYNWGNYTNMDMIKKFEEQHNVKVTFTDYDSNATALAKVRQGGTGFDIAVPSQAYLPVWVAEGLVQEIGASQMPNFKNLEKEWANPPFDPDRKYSVPWAWGTVGVAVNTSIYKGDIDSWSILFDPPEELKGKINVVPEMGDVINAAIFYNGGHLCDGDKTLLKKVQDTLLKAKPYWVAMEYNTVEKMGAGDFKATSDWNGSALRQRLANPDIRFGYPKEGMAIWSDNVVVLKEAKNVENAKLFMNFLMDPENAGMNSAYHRYATGIAGADKYMPADMKGAHELNMPADALKKAEFSYACPTEVRDLYTKIWTDLRK